jgi:hypothetical protein
VFTDVERLCNVYIPRWLATPGMAAEKIAAFYDDPVREAYHAHAAHKAFHLKSLTIETGVTWAARRWMRFFGRTGIGMMRRWVGRAERSLPAANTGTALRFARSPRQTSR